ncbi:hypothetical protein B0H19DRAFT_1055660 [Mycena capillaripes]|nr:hypothetical protein B0H19DRAFT_1055660 [Mycena capillaripes]
MPPHFVVLPYSPPDPQKLLQQKWLEAAFENGPLPEHPIHQRDVRRFDPRDDDPPAADLRLFQQQLADANLEGRLLTFDRDSSCWKPLIYIFCYFSPTHSSKKIKRKPSGFRDLPDSSLPLCPHFGNTHRREAECRMRYHSHRSQGLGLVHYLQVPTNMHPCSFVAVLRDHSSVKLEVKDEVKDESLTPTLGVKHEQPPSLKREHQRGAVRVKSELFGPPLRAMALTRRNTPLRKASGRPLKRENALMSIPPAVSSSSPIAGPSSSPIIIDSDDDDPVRPSSPTPHAPRAPRPLPQPLSAASRRHRPASASTYTAAEADANLAGDHVLRELVRLRTAEVLATNDFTRHIWQEDTHAFPPRLAAYSLGSSLARRVGQASHYTTTAVGRFINTLSNTHGAAGVSFDNFVNLLRTCPGCGNHFTPAAHNTHLERDGNHHRCTNHPTRTIVLFVSESVDYRDLLPPRTFPIGRAPGQAQPARFREFGYVTALGIALSALNTRLGLPGDIWQAARSAMVACVDCGCIRTVHAHLDHLQDGFCHNVAAGHFFVALGPNEVAAIGPHGERTFITLGDD